MIFIALKLFNCHCSYKKIYFSFAIICVLLSLELFIPEEITVLVNMVFPIIEIIILKICSRTLDIKNFTLFLLFVYFINSIITVCIITLFKVSIENGMIIEIAVCIISFTIMSILCFSKKNRMIFLITTIPTIVKIVLDTLLLFCYILVMLIGNQSIFIDKLWSQTLQMIVLFFVIVLSISITLFTIYSVTSKSNKRLSDNYKKQISAESIFYIQLAKSNHELRQFKHNYKNTNIGLMRLLSEGKSEEALKLLEAQNQDLDSTSVQFDTGNGIVDALLTDKQRQAGNINTTITFEGAVPRDSIEAVDLCIIFGNPLDNAIEACAEIDSETLKEIHIDCVCNSGFVFIEITNPVQKKVEIRGNLPETTKPDKEMHGFGLYSLEKVIKKYDGEVTCECDETIFKLSMELSIPVKES